MSAADRLDQIEARVQAAAQALTSGTTGTPPNIDGLSTDDALGILGDAAADVPALVAAVRAVLDKHRRCSEQVLVGDCAAETCGHEDECPTAPFDVCRECYRVGEESDPYFAERGVEYVAWPCPTVQAVTDALGGERA